LHIGLANQGVPAVAREIELPLEDGVQNATGAVLRAIEQVDDYNQTLESALDTDAFPIVLIGPGTLTAELAVAVEQEQRLKREVRTFKPNLVCPPDFPLDEYAVNLGLMLSDGTKSKEGKGSPQNTGLSINLLPTRHVPFSLASLPKGPILVSSSLVILGPGILLLWLGGGPGVRS
jgi:hypothetical protein